jgi:hypothetical protein
MQARACDTVVTRRASGKRRSAQGSGRSVEHQIENLVLYRLDDEAPLGPSSPRLGGAYLPSCPRTAPAGNTSL